MAKPIQIFTIGFTQKTAEVFFKSLIEAGVKRIIDARANNTSQLAAFTKRDDLRYFLKTIADIDYIHVPEFAPSKDILDDYKKKRIDWNAYEERFGQLIRDRKIEDRIAIDLLDSGCLLCSEPKPNHCHRRLVAEYFLENLPLDIKICHL
ncbi:hypothetical protein AY599_17690 [Leptolyngbya valderiana BDU 20041]|nr:DUF488 domain-containing protein [Geitlerinema sp. CS-897]OAB60970.1 hypothetical protein AY599_17690 [Leptolyngbya valderiana BDU 20041]